MSKKKNRIHIVKPSIENRNSICPFDFCELIRTAYLNVNYKGNMEEVLTKQCPKCKRNYYIHVNYFKDLSRVGIGPNNYYNLNLGKNSIREELVIVSEPGAAQTVYKRKSKVLEEQKKKLQSENAESKNAGTSNIDSITPKQKEAIQEEVVTSKVLPEFISRETASGYVCKEKPKKISRCTDFRCKTELSKVAIEWKSKKGKRVVGSAKKCPVCGKYYIHWRLYYDNPWIIRCLNEQHFEDIKRTESERLKKTNTKKSNTKSAQVNPVRIKSEVLSRLKANTGTDPLKNSVANTKTEPANSNKTFGNRQNNIAPNNNTIQVKDFVVRRNVFRCMYKAHSLVNVNASMNLINKDGNIIQTTVSAGYCKDCNTYFIMESTFQKLKSRGTPVCRISDEKAYLSGYSNVNGMKLANESLLMQYGYNVSQQEGLTTARRHKILAILIDNSIMTKSEIISYLDFFINQRQYQHKYEKAIEKWSIDKDFVDEYRAGRYTTIGVSGIYLR